MKLKFATLLIGFMALLFTGFNVQAQTDAYTAAGLTLPTVKSDKDDYAPGEIAIITGTGWAKDQIVDVHFEETPAYHLEHQHDFHGISVDSAGSWHISYQIEQRHLGVAFKVHVLGKQTSYEAFAYFTDAGTASVTSLSPIRNALAAVKSADVSVTINESWPTGTPARNSLSVWSSQAGGKKTGSNTVSGSTNTFNPNIDFKPGETIFASIAGQSGLANNHVYQFTIAAAVAPGTYSAPTNLPVGTEPSSVAVADVDADGDMDIISANQRSNNVSVLKNNGSGTYSAATNFLLGTIPFMVAAADVDGDGDMDIITANIGSNNVSVLKNNGSGTYSAATNFLVGTTPSGIASTDVDGDGDMDIISANFSSHNVSVLKNNGSGTYSVATNFLVGTYPFSVAAADVDGDGDMDIISANASNNVSVLKNNGSGAYSAATNFLVGTNPRIVTAADVDGDGDIDIISANEDSNNVSVLKNNGSGTYSAATNFLVGTAPRSVASADVDGDGDIDIISANAASNNVSVLLNTILSTATTTTLTNATSIYGDAAVNLVATVAPTPIGASTNGGSVEFFLKDYPSVGGNTSIGSANKGADNKYTLAYDPHLLNAGTYTIISTFSGVGTFTTSTNSTGTLQVTPKAITVSADADQKKVYGATDPTSFAYTPSEALADGNSFTGKLARTAGENVSTYAYNIGDLSAGDNYSVTINGTSTFAITPKAITVSADADQKKVYGAADPTSFAYTSLPSVGSSLANGETISFAGALTRAAGENFGSYAIQQGTLANSNYNITFNTSNFSVTQRPIAITVNSGQTKMFGTSDPLPFTYTVGGNGLASWDELNGALARTDGETVVGSPYEINQGTLTIRNKTSPNASAVSNYSVTFSPANFTITAATTTTTLITSAGTLRYMDNLTMTAQIKPLNTGSALTGPVEFKIGSVTYGTVGVVPVPVSTDGTVEATLIKQVSELPGSYTITATFASTNSNYAGSNNSKALVVNPRNASPSNVNAGFYSGDVFAWTTSSTSSKATVTLIASLKDNEVPNGDLRAAKVTFYYVNGLTLTPIPSAKDIPVGLVDVNDGSVGFATATVQFDIGSNNALNYQVAVGVSGAYTNNPNNILSQATITVSKPVPGGYIVGGSQITNNQSNGYVKGQTDMNTDYQFDITYTKSGSNPKGKAKVTVRSYYKADGTLDKTLHTYVISTNAISTLNIAKNSDGSATGNFTAKANLDEYFDDGRSSVAIEGGATFQMEAFQKDCDQQVAITLFRKAGGIWFSSNWNGSKTVRQAVNLKSVVFVAGGGTCSVLATSSKLASTTPISDVDKGLNLRIKEPTLEQNIKLTAYPNPFGKQATIAFTLPTDEQNVTLDVFDLKGLRIQRIYEGKAAANQTLEFGFNGSNLPAGMYLLRLTTPGKVENFKMIMTE